MVADALQHVYGHGYVHNNLKVNNVVLEIGYGAEKYNNSVKIYDAKPQTALSKHLRDLDSYIAPEVLNGSGKPSPSSDIYSFAHMSKFVSECSHFTLSAKVNLALDC